MGKNCYGVGITFNSKSTYDEESEGTNPTHLLGMRIAYSVLGANEAYSDFRRQTQSLSIRQVLDQMFKVIEPDAHILLCIDEVLLGAGMFAYRDYRTDQPEIVQQRVQNLVSAIEVELDHFERLHVVCSSLSFVHLKKLHSATGRPMVPIRLSNLGFDHVKELAKYFLSKRNVPSWINDPAAMQILKDCDGVPRLIKEVFECLRPNKTMEYLRGSCKGVGSLEKLKVTDSLVKVSLILALRGKKVGQTDGERSLFDKAVYMGYLLNSSAKDNEQEPVFPLLSILILGDKDDVVDPVVKKIFNLLGDIMKFDKTPNERRAFKGTEFEDFFRLVWDLRMTCRLHQVYENKQHGVQDRGPKGGAQKMTMVDILTTNNVGPLVHGSATVFDKTPLQVPADTTRYTFGKLQPADLAKIGTLIPGSAQEPGLDDIRVYREYTLADLEVGKKRKKVDKNAKTVVFAFQYKWAEPEDATNSAQEVAEAIVRTLYNNRECLSPFVADGRFGFVFVAYRSQKARLQPKAVTKYLQEWLARKEASGTATSSTTSDSLLQIQEWMTPAFVQIAFMHAKQIDEFIPRPLRSRPQFRFANI